MRQLAMTGSTGLIGTALRQRLLAEGWSVLRLVRHERRSDEEVRWDPSGRIPIAEEDVAKLCSSDAVVHLAGENVAGGLWTKERMQRIRDSRVRGTKTLVAALATCEQKPGIFLSASAVGFYGDRRDEVLTETSARGDGFLAEVCQEWEMASLQASQHGIRTVITRFGVALDAQGGALAKMLPAFRLGLGASLGNGKQWIPWVSLDDVVNALVWLLNSAEAEGIYNVVSPNPVTQEQFADALAAAVHRPRLFSAPAFLLRAVAGKMSDEALLASERVVPAILQQQGFAFRDAEIGSALRRILP